MDPYAVDIEACRGRQRRLLEAVEPLDVDLMLLTRRESVQWLTGAHCGAVRADRGDDGGRPRDAGGARSAARSGGRGRRADRLRGQVAFDESRRAAGGKLGGAASENRRTPKRVACEFEAFSPVSVLGVERAAGGDRCASCSSCAAARMPTSCGCCARANEANRAMYEHGADDRAAGRERAGYLFRAARRGGAHAGRAADVLRPGLSRRRHGRPAAQPAARSGRDVSSSTWASVFAATIPTTARAIAVGGEPTAAQQRAWQAVTAVFRRSEANGAARRQLPRAVSKRSIAS